MYIYVYVYDIGTYVCTVRIIGDGVGIIGNTAVFILLYEYIGVDVSKYWLHRATDTNGIINVFSIGTMWERNQPP